jgi:hypothetical protein
MTRPEGRLAALSLYDRGVEVKDGGAVDTAEPYLAQLHPWDRWVLRLGQEHDWVDCRGGKAGGARV